MAAKKNSFLYNNSLSLVVGALTIIFIAGQFISGYHVYTDELREEQLSAVSMKEYFFSGHFLQATFENWESEFLQMALFVLFTVWFRQKGSAESKDIDEAEEAKKRQREVTKDSPWPARKGGLIKKLYENSLVIVFTLLFFLSFGIHYYGSYKDYKIESITNGEMPVSFSEYIFESRLWFESFQNWQSEFLAVFCIVVFTIFLRQKGSAQSKPVEAPNDETGV